MENKKNLTYKDYLNFKDSINITSNEISEEIYNEYYESAILIVKNFLKDNDFENLNKEYIKWALALLIAYNMKNKNSSIEFIEDFKIPFRIRVVLNNSVVKNDKFFNYNNYLTNLKEKNLQGLRSIIK